MINVDDYTQSVGSVMSAEKHYRYPLEPNAIRELWMMWKQRNPEAMHYIEQQAIAINWTSYRVSAKYIVEKLRYESGIKLNAVPFVDEDGNERTYGINNTITHFIGVWLKERHPDMQIEVKRSRFDD